MARSKSGRPAAKRGANGPAGPKSSGRVTPKATGRYTPPVPRESKVSPRWVPALMFVFLGSGVLVILANYVNLLPGDQANNWYLLAGLVLITAGFITSTRYR